MERLKFALQFCTLNIKVLSNLERQNVLFSERSWKRPKGALNTHKRERSDINNSIHTYHIYFSTGMQADCIPLWTHRQEASFLLLGTTGPVSVPLQPSQRYRDLTHTHNSFSPRTQSCFQETVVYWPRHQPAATSRAHCSSMLQLNSLVRVPQTCRECASSTFPEI